MAIEYKPHVYQGLIMSAIHATKRLAVWAGMGLGKSVSTATALEDLSLTEDVYPVLIVAPLRVARTTWPQEYRKWNHLKHRNVVTICGSPKERQAALRTKADIYTVNFEQLEWLVEQLGDKWPFRTVVVDEATKLKGFRMRQGTRRARALARVAHTKIKRIILLTGTPSLTASKTFGVRCGSWIRAIASGALTMPSSNAGSGLRILGLASRQRSRHKNRFRKLWATCASRSTQRTGSTSKSRS